MANLFDAGNAPEGEPTSITVGDFVRWKRAKVTEDYPTATHTMEYVARLSSTLTDEFKVQSTATADAFLFTVSSLQSSGFVSGSYKWQLEVTEISSGDRIVIESGEMEVLADLDVNNADSRSHAEIMLAKIETILEGKADSDVSNYSVAGRSLTKMTFEELMAARNDYRREVVDQRRRSLAKRGKPSGTTVKVRFS
jgi:tryptophan 2,3-dioxygenase